MSRTIRRLGMAAAAMVVLAACGGDEVATTDETPATDVSPTAEDTEMTTEADTETMAPSPSAATIATAQTDLGEVLVDGEGRTLYVFDQDSDGESSCYDDCASNWPAVTGDPVAGDGVDASLLGTAERRDGTSQATYAGSPLYLFAGDSAPGDVNGQGVGNVWWVVGPDGQKIQDATQSSGY